MNELILTTEFKDKIKLFKQDWTIFYKEISNQTTPKVDGNGAKIIKNYAGYDYIIDSYMDNRLDFYFPGWSWRRAGGLNFLGPEWVVADGELFIIDENLLQFGINPPYRIYWGSAAARVTYKSGADHKPENIVDISHNVTSANSRAKKVAINRLTGIGDDIYGKRIEEEGAGDIESIVIATGNMSLFGQWVQEEKHLQWSEVFAILGIKTTLEIKDCAKAIEIIKEKKGWK
jgi:hypothetical protein